MDYYQIVVSDRIVLSGRLVGGSIVRYFATQGRVVTGARYFTNAAGTKTGGVDVVANYGLDFGAMTTRNAPFGIFPDSQVSPFGFNGRCVSGRVSYGF